MAGLTDSKVVTDVGTGNETQAADKGSSTVRQDVTVQVRGDNDIVVLGLAEELVNHGVDNLLLNVDGRELLSGKGLARGLTEETVGLGKDVGLVGDGDHGLVAGGGGRGSGADVLAAESDLTSDGGDTARGTLGDTLDSLGNLAVGALGGALLLHVKVLGVLADNDEVNRVTVAATDSGLDGANIGEEVELLAQSDNGGRVTSDLGAGGARGWRSLSAGPSWWDTIVGLDLPDSTEKSAIALLLQSVDGLVGQSSSGLLESVVASLEVNEVELEVQGRGKRLEKTTTSLYYIKKPPGQSIGSSFMSLELPTGMTSRPIPSPGMRPR